MSDPVRDPIHRPGRLGDPELSMGEDPRADPRMIAAFAPLGLDQHSPSAPIDSVAPLEDRRAYVAGFEQQFAMVINALFPSPSPVAGTTSTVVEIPGADGNRITLYIHRATGSDEPLPGVVHLHGGGMVMFEASWPNYRRWRDELALAGTVAIGVEFRNAAGVLGPHPFPAGLDDCASALRWVHAHRADLGISSIVVSGESGGGNLSLASALLANRDGWIDEIDGVYAQCPFISNKWGEKPADLPSLHENDGYLMDVGAMDVLASVYDPGGTNSDNPLCWPSRARPADLTGLPPHVISVNELDPFRDEGLDYARELARAGVSVVSRMVGGTCHAGDTLLPEALSDVYLSTIRDIAGFAQSLSDDTSVPSRLETDER